MNDIVVNVLLFLGVAFLIAKAVREGYESSMSKKTKKKTPSKKSKTWWQKNISPLWEEATFLKITYFVCALIVGALLLYLFGLLYLEILWIDWDTVGTKDSIIRNLAIAFLGTTSGIVALFGVWLAIRRTDENKRQNDIADEQNQIANEENQIATKQNEIANTQNDIANTQNEIANRQAYTAEQGQITDRLNKAVEGLGKHGATGEPVLEVRLGALYALERIAKDSERDHIQIMEILCAYIRTNSPRYDKDGKEQTDEPREDVKVALTIIGRRDKWPEGKKRIETETAEKYELDLTLCNLQNVDLREATLNNAKFFKTSLRDATLTRAKLNYAWLSWTDLTHAWLDGAKLDNARLSFAITDGVNAYIGDFSKCHKLTQKQIDVMFLGKKVILKEGHQHPQEGTDYCKDGHTFDDFLELHSKWKLQKMAEAKPKPKPKEPQF